AGIARGGAAGEQNPNASGDGCGRGRTGRLRCASRTAARAAGAGRDGRRWRGVRGAERGIGDRGLFEGVVVLGFGAALAEADARGPGDDDGNEHDRAGGPATGDPRQPGNNYLHLASAVSPDQAQQAVNYLASRGFTAAAIPTVDRRGRPSNDSGSYDLFSLLPIPSAEYSARRSERESHQRLARNLGRDWLARPEGNINFDSTQWRKFDG
ncbi:MAG: hypothetical protein AAFY58_05010, partial [Planctomycetota bacterium]